MNPLKNLIEGVLLVDKGQAMTSHDVVAMARRCLNLKKIGHCGTLDPMATGLLILVLGRATKISELLMSENKEYVGALTLGATTSTQDKEGEVLETREVPDLSNEEIEAVFAQFKGEFYQTPPMVSAIKKDGVPLYKLARQGKEVKRDPRLTNIYDYKIDGVNLPEIKFTVTCSKGFYVRTYAHDIGEKLGCGAHLSALRRTRSGKFNVSTAVSWEALKEGRREEVLDGLMSLPEVSRLRGA
ncbi:MAG: tRNA pseudouridine55 synthase [Verrucomicrobiales bacterium]|jgi:tRNA pseudouridine55 synthase